MWPSLGCIIGVVLNGPWCSPQWTVTTTPCEVWLGASFRDCSEFKTFQCGLWLEVRHSVTSFPILGGLFWVSLRGDQDWPLAPFLPVLLGKHNSQVHPGINILLQPPHHLWLPSMCRCQVGIPSVNQKDQQETLEASCFLQHFTWTVE